MLLYKYMKAEYVLSSILEKQIKVSTLDKLNDPYELLPCVIDTDRQYLSSARCREIFITLLAKKHGVICLSATVEDPVLWAHYADGHTGAAFEFELPKDSLLEVDYLDERVFINIPDVTFESPPSEALMLALIKRKFTSWAYEREYRVHVDLATSSNKSGLYFEPIPPHYLRRIILGCECVIPVESVKHCLGRSGYDQVGTARAQLSDTCFNMIIK